MIDPVINSVRTKLDGIRRQTALLDDALSAYGNLHRSSSFMLPAPRPLVGHYPLLESDACGCPLCIDWAVRRRELRQAEAAIPEGHRYHICDCSPCYFVKRVWLAFKAAENRRDLLIGASFHAAHHSRQGDRVMEWFMRELSTDVRGVNWWALEGGRYPVSRWLRRCDQALGGDVFKGIEL